MLKIALIIAIIFTFCLTLVSSTSRPMSFQHPKVYLRDGVFFNMPFPYRPVLRKCRYWEDYNLFVCSYTIHHEYGRSWGGCHIRTGHAIKCWASMPNYWQLATD
jgi:hypothetical protein